MERGTPADLATALRRNSLHGIERPRTRGHCLGAKSIRNKIGRRYQARPVVVRGDGVGNVVYKGQARGMWMIRAIVVAAFEDALASVILFVKVIVVRNDILLFVTATISPPSVARGAW